MAPTRQPFNPCNLVGDDDGSIVCSADAPDHVECILHEVVDEDLRKRITAPVVEFVNRILRGEAAPDPGPGYQLPNRPGKHKATKR